MVEPWKWRPWAERAAESEMRKEAFDARREAERALVLKALRASEGMCRREIREATGLTYNEINDALDRLIVEDEAVRLADRNLIEYYGVKK